MAFKKLLSLGITALSFSLLNILIFYFVRKRYNRIKAALRSPEEPYKFIFITSNNFKCVKHIPKKLTCGDTCSNAYLNEIVAIISSAEKTISLCMYHLTLESIAEVMIKAHNHKMKVRIITDKEMTFVSGSQINRLIESGIEVKTPSETIGLFHHKFCLIDEYREREAQILYGSVNYTIQGLCNNWEVLVITDKLEIIQRFRDHFEDLWNNYC